MGQDSVMKEKTYRVYIAVFFIAIFLFLFFSVITFKQINDLVTISDQVERTYEIQNKTQELLADLINAETGQRGYLIIRDSVFLEPYFLAQQKIDTRIQSLSELVKGSPKQVLNVKHLKAVHQERIELLNDVLNDFAPGGNASDYSKRKMYEGKSLMDSCREIIETINYIEDGHLGSIQQKEDKKVRSASIFALIAMMVSLAIILVAFYKIDYDLNKMRGILKRLNLANYKLTTAQEVGNMGQWVWNINKNQIAYSDQHYRQLGYEPGDYPETVESFFAMVHKEDLDQVTKIGELILAGQEAEDVVYRMRKKDGGIAYLITKYSFIEDGETGDKLAIGVNLDISKDIENATSLELRNEHLIKINSELSSFNYIASHDLQEPLRKIQMFISRIDADENTTISGRSSKFFEKIKDAANRMQALINDLLAFSRLNKTDKVMEPIDLNTLFENIREEWAQTIEEKKAEIIVPQLPEIKGVPFLIQTLFSNLIGNSLKYCPEDRPPKIEIFHQQIGSQKLDFYKEDNYQRFHKILIQDNGIGFENDYADKIFELFQRLHDKNTFAGTGIGLAICKKIVATHDGFIKAEGTPGQGAKFIIYLPV